MKLHNSVVEKLLYYMQTYGGFENETRLRDHIEKLDLTVYERKTRGSEMILVLTDDYVKELTTKS